MAEKQVWVIDGQIFLDRKTTTPIQVPIGPFDTKEEAELFMWRFKPYWGAYDIRQVFTPRDTADRAQRPGAFPPGAASSHHDE